MQEAKRMVDEANRMGHQAQVRLQNGLELAGRSFAEGNERFQSLAAEMAEYSKATFDDAVRTWEQLVGVKSIEQAIQIQSAYAQRAYENHMAQMAKLGQMWVATVTAASQPVREASRGFK